MANPFRIFPSRSEGCITLVNRVPFSQDFHGTSAHPTLFDSPTPMLIEQVTHGAPAGTSVLKEASPTPSMSGKYEEGEKKRYRKKDLADYNLDGLNCPICMEPWTLQGDHQVCCLPCGHVYGLSCINKWIQHRHGYFAKCPQCNVKINPKDITKLYASPVIVVNEDLRKNDESFEAENVSLKTERTNLLFIQDCLLKELRHLKKQACKPLGDTRRNPDGFITGEVVHKRQNVVNSGNNVGGCGSLHCNFVLEHEISLEGARLFDMDAYYKVLLLARRISGMGGTHILNKINLINPNGNEDMQLPPGTKAVKDLRLSPCGRLALLASLGKKLSIFSMGGNNVVITYDLPGPAWSCAWDLNSPHYMYTGLQNGTLLVFDMRHTVHPVQYMDGLSSRPIHTIHSFEHNPTLCQSATQLLTASSTGPCLWNTTNGKERAFPVPDLENQGPCISLAYSPSSEDIVASFRPKTQMSNETGNFQVGEGTTSSLVLVKKVAGCFYHKFGSASTHLGDVVTTKSAIIHVENCHPMFAYGNDIAHGLRLLELPSLSVTQSLKPHQHPILDVKYSQFQGSGVLGCISEDKLQLFSAIIL